MVWFLKLIRFQSVFHYLEFKRVFTILKLDSLVKLVFRCLSLLFVLLFQLCVSLFVYLSLDQTVTISNVELLCELQTKMIPTLLSLRFLNTRTIHVRTIVWWFAWITLVITLWWVLTALVVPVNIVAVTLLVYGELKLWFSLRYYVIVSTVFGSSIWWGQILHILCIEYRHLYDRFRCSAKRRSFTEFWFEDLIDLNLTECLFIQTSG